MRRDIVDVIAAQLRIPVLSRRAIAAATRAGKFAAAIPLDGPITNRRDTKHRFADKVLSPAN